MKFKDYITSHEENKINEVNISEFDIEKILKVLSSEISKDLNVKINLELNKKGGFNKEWIYSKSKEDLTDFIKFPFVNEMWVQANLTLNKDGAIYADVSYKYEHFDRGSNGTSIGIYMFNIEYKLINKRLDIK